MTEQDWPARWLTYSRAHVRIEHPKLGTLEVRPDPTGKQHGGFPAGCDQLFHVMTAHNPGRVLSDVENNRRHARLLSVVSQMHGVEVCPAVGGDPTWTHSEESLAVVGLTDDEALSLARQFDQEAIFAWSRDSWRLLSCSSDAQVTMGWYLDYRSG